MDCSAKPAQGERGMLYPLRVSSNTLCRPEIDKEKKRAIQEDILIRSFFSLSCLPSAAPQCEEEQYDCENVSVTLRNTELIPLLGLPS